jgi:uncharacterized membrane protein
MVEMQERCSSLEGMEQNVFVIFSVSSDLKQQASSMNVIYLYTSPYFVIFGVLLLLISITIQRNDKVRTTHYVIKPKIWSSVLNERKDSRKS